MDSVFRYSRMSITIFILSIATALFWAIAQLTDVYHFALAGAIFELLSLPMLALIFVLPILSVLNLIKENFSPRSLYLYNLIILAGAVMVILM